MKLSDLITELNAIAARSDDWKNADVEQIGNNTDGQDSPCTIKEVMANDFGTHLQVLICTDDH